MHRRCLLGATALLLVLVASASPSAAETHAAKDPRRDVVRYTPDNGERPAPRVANGDIIRHRITYRDDRLVAVVRFRSLTRRAPVLWVGVSLDFPLGGGDRGYGELELVIKHNGPRQPRAEFNGNPESECAVESRVRYGRDRIRMAMPASCMGSPTWVLAYAGAYQTDSLREPSYFLSDTSPDDRRGHDGVRIDRD